MDEPERVGAMARSARLRRGLSLDVVAGLSGHSKSWLSKIERGLLPLERRRDLAALADALSVSPADLTGQPYDPDERSATTAAQAAIPAIRRALLDAPAASPSPVEELAADVETLTVRRQAYRLDEAAAALPALLTRLRGRSDEAAVRVRCWAWSETSSLLRDLGHGDLALLVLERFTVDADRLGDPALLAMASFQRAHTLSSTAVGAFRAAADEADTAGDTATRATGPEALVAVGGLRLAAGFAWAAAGRPREAAARLDEAGEIAARVTVRTEMARHSAFGAANVALHRVSVGVEAGEPDSAVRASATVAPDQLPWPSRRAAYWADLGRAHAQLHQDSDALRALRHAEEIAPLRVRLHPLVREAVADMMDRAQRAAVGWDLRGLAYRMGVAP